LIIVFLIVLIDQIIKLIVKFNLQLGQEIEVIGSVFKIHYLENPGAAFGLTITGLYEFVASFFVSEPSLPESIGKLILSIFSILVAGLIGYYLYTIKNIKTLLPTFVAMILAGALGNIIDRIFYGQWFSAINDYEGGLFYGRVVDMFYIDIWQGNLPEWIPLIVGEYYAFWPVFNIADASISIAIVCILVFQKKLIEKPENEKLEPKVNSDYIQTGESQTTSGNP